MPSQILVISKDTDDIEFANSVGKANDLPCAVATDRVEARWILSAQQPTLVFWDAENEASYQAIGEILPKYVKAPRIFAITSKPLENYPHLYRYPYYGHHLIRRYQKPGASLLRLIASTALKTDQFSLSNYFPAETPIKKITIARFSHTRAAIEALQNHLSKQGIRGRLAGLVATAADELILNAIFKAPSQAKSRTLEEADFELTGEAQIEVELAAADEYMGVCVTDQYGSLKKLKFFDSIRKHYSKAGTSEVGDSTAIGLHGVLSAGFSLALISKPKDKTQAMLFFPRVENFKDFRTGFRFLTMTEHLASS